MINIKLELILKEHGMDPSQYYIFWYGSSFIHSLKEEKDIIFSKSVEVAKRSIKDYSKQVLVFVGDTTYTGYFAGVYSLIKTGKETESYMICDYKKEPSPIDDYIDRLILRSPSKSVLYYTSMKSFDVEALLPKKQLRSLPEFTSYSDFELTFLQLKEAIDNNYLDYVSPLSKVKGIYMIIDTKTGKQYIGSASGSKGLYGRFYDYVSNGHGGDLELVELLKDNPKYAENFKFILLEILGMNYNVHEVVNRENHYKERFLSRRFGLNKN